MNTSLKVIQLYKNENKLIQKAIKNNRKAQNVLYELHAPKMLSICRYYIKDLQKAEEVMLNGFFKVFTQLKTFKAEGSFEGWIRRIIVNTCLDAIRKNAKTKFDVSLDDVSYKLDYTDTGMQHLEVEELMKLIQKDKIMISFLKKIKKI